jgi:hypothetical protein
MAAKGLADSGMVDMGDWESAVLSHSASSLV